jgi:hypothetical protein
MDELLNLLIGALLLKYATFEQSNYPIETTFQSIWFFCHDGAGAPPAVWPPLRFFLRKIPVLASA